MKVYELNNLWVGYNATEKFRVLICALDELEAREIADSYCLDAHMSGKFEISEFYNCEINFDCDYVLTFG